MHPRQLEALKKAREAKRLLQLQKTQPVFSASASNIPPSSSIEEKGNVPIGDIEDIDMSHVSGLSNKEHNPNNPPSVVRDNKLLKEFIETEKINAQETGLGRRQRDEPRGFQKLREHLDFDAGYAGYDEEEEEGFLSQNKKILLGVGVGVGCGLGLAYWASAQQRGRQQASLKTRVQQEEGRAFAQSSNKARSEPLESTTPPIVPTEIHLLKAPWER